jgi:hypothetical protein
MLIGALGCNLAWGIIDAVFYLMACLAQKGHNLQMLKAVRATADPQQAQRLIADALPPTIAAVLDPSEFDSLHQRLHALPEPAKSPRLTREDWLGAIGVFFLVFLSTLPVVLLFLSCMIAPAMRLQRVAIVLLALKRRSPMTGRNRGLTGSPALGALLVALTIALGGRRHCEARCWPPGHVAAAGSAMARSHSPVRSPTPLVPDDADYLLLIITGDRGVASRGRYNYGVEAASAWIATTSAPAGCDARPHRHGRRRVRHHRHRARMRARWLRKLGLQRGRISSTSRIRRAAFTTGPS